MCIVRVCAFSILPIPGLPSLRCPVRFLCAYCLLWERLCGLRLATISGNSQSVTRNLRVHELREKNVCTLEDECRICIPSKMLHFELFVPIDIRKYRPCLKNLHLGVDFLTVPEEKNNESNDDLFNQAAMCL